MFINALSSRPSNKGFISGFGQIRVFLPDLEQDLDHEEEYYDLDQDNDNENEKIGVKEDQDDFEDCEENVIEVNHHESEFEVIA